ncbi:MAG: NAD(P)H-dependent flavin oxidoreductase [Novosphingobium sp.]
MIAQLRLTVPIVQAPMAGVSTPALAAAVSDAGALGSIAVGAVESSEARAMLLEVRSRTQRSFNVNVFVHKPARAMPERESAWLSALAPAFQRFNAQPPSRLRAIYKSFAEDDEMLRLLVEMRPAVVSFHFGLPSADRICALKNAGCFLLATVTNADEANAAERAGIDAVVAQGWEAGGHRGIFDPGGPDPCLGTFALVRLLVRQSKIPVIAAGGIMNGQGVRAVLDLGAGAAQIGTAFIACPESSADDDYRARLFSPAATRTTMTRAISGRPARCLGNAFTAMAESIGLPPPDYPIAYDAGKALNSAAKASGERGFGAHWAGQGAPLARALPAAELIADLAREMRV